jgi:hypothetical protein
MSSVRLVKNAEHYSRISGTDGSVISVTSGKLHTRNPGYSSTKVWDTETVNSDNTSDVHDSLDQTLISVFGKVVTGEAVFVLQFSADKSEWFDSSRVITTDNGVVDAGYDDMAVRYLRLKMISSDQCTATIIISGKP